MVEGIPRALQAIDNMLAMNLTVHEGHALGDEKSSRRFLYLLSLIGGPPSGWQGPNETARD